MQVKRLVAGAMVMAATFLLTAAGPNWLTVVSLNGTGHRIGNPDAKVKLVEYVSYTCPHCAEFVHEGEGAIQLAYISTGKVNVEVRHLIRDPIDLTVAALTNCGPVAKFPQNHSAFFMAQDNWIGPLRRPTAAQSQRWRTPGVTGRRAIANDFGLYAIMERRGYSRTEVDRCLADDAKIKQIADASDADWDRPGISGTPAFAINGIVMPGTHTWASLSPQLEQFVRNANGG